MPQIGSVDPAPGATTVAGGVSTRSNHAGAGGGTTGGGDDTGDDTDDDTGDDTGGAAGSAGAGTGAWRGDSGRPPAIPGEWPLPTVTSGG